MDNLQNSKVKRPWGYFIVLDEGEKFKVKRILVNPKQKLSLQYHLHRAEHWTLVEGEATVTLEDKIITLTPKESTYIPVKAMHSLANDGDNIMQIIEVQLGDYLGEDDIVRVEDNYGRI